MGALSSVVLLGPQSIGQQAGRVLAELGVTRPVALVTAGWQERESEDEVLAAALGVPSINLRLHARSEELFGEGGRREESPDPALTAAYKARQERLRHMQVFYRMRLESADDVAHAIAVRHVDHELIEEEQQVSIDLFRQLDADHLSRCLDVHAAFEAAWRPDERPSIRRHRDELAAILAPAGALVIAGGHVGSLLNRLRLFEVIALARAARLPIVAWSAGAMVLTERIVCFHDYPPYGKDIAQVLDAGYGLAPGVVVLPDPQRRVRMDDRPGIGRFARRMAPATCLALDYGAELWFESGRLVRGRAYRLTPAGEAERDWSLA